MCTPTIVQAIVGKPFKINRRKSIYVMKKVHKGMNCKSIKMSVLKERTLIDMHPYL